MSSDPTTLAFYATEAERYATRGEPPNRIYVDRFAARLAPGAAVLELGCGGGQDSAAMLAKGLDVTPTDGTPDMAVEAAKRLGRPVAVLRFDAIDAVSRYDGVYANACLLHVPRADLTPILAAIHRALRVGGVFYASFKEGTAEGRDKFGRFYNYPSAEWLSTAFAAAGFAAIDIEPARGGGYDALPTPWLHVLAIKPA